MMLMITMIVADMKSVRMAIVGSSGQTALRERREVLL